MDNSPRSNTLFVTNPLDGSVDLDTDWQRQLKKCLRLGSVLRELVFEQRTLDYECSGSEVIKVFKQNPTLPGIIVTEAGQFVGMISRQRFYEHITSFRYSMDVFWNRSLRLLHQFFQSELLIISCETPIVAATQQALQRPAERLYEPIVIRVSEEDYRLLDMQQLLLAQAQIHELTVDALRITEAKHRALLQAIPDLIFVSARGYFFAWSRGSQPLSHRPPTQVLGLTVDDVFPPYLCQEVLHYLDQTLATGEQQVFESQIQHQGQLYDFETRLVLSECDQVLAMVRDVTVRKRAESYRLLLERHSLMALTTSVMD